MEKIIDLDLSKMSFSEAMEKMLEGKKIRRSGWDKGDYTRFDNNDERFVNFYSLETEGDSDYSYDLGDFTVEDFLACDWEVLCK